MWERIRERLGFGNRHREHGHDEKSENEGASSEFEQDRERWDYSDQKTEHPDWNRAQKNRW
jgi:hypothetical protein